MILLPLHWDHFSEQGLGALGGAAAQMALAALGAHQAPPTRSGETVWRLPYGSLVCIFPAFCLRGTAKLLSTKYAAG